MVKSMARLALLEESDLDMILASLPLTTRRLVKRAWPPGRPSAKEAAAEKAERRDLHTFTNEGRDLHTFTAVKVGAFVVPHLLLMWAIKRAWANELLSAPSYFW